MSELLTTIESKLRQQFGDGILSAQMDYDFPVYTLRKDLVKSALKFLKEDDDCGFDFLTTMCGIHYPDNVGHEFGLMYQLHNMPKNHRIRIKTFMSKEHLEMPTVSDLFPSANWMEREAFDFYGFHFTGHPNLKRILNMDEMNYHPLRKEYPLEDLQREDKDNKFFGR